jgi:hypothetical protein
MATTINGVSRYNGQSVLTTFVPEDMMERHYEVVNIEFGDASVTKSVLAPCTGKVVHAQVQSQTTTSGSNKVSVTIANQTDAADIVATTLFDDDPVLTTNTAATLTLSTTAADLLVTKGDAIELAYVETGTIAGGAVSLYFLPNSELE